MRKGKASRSAENRPHKSNRLNRSNRPNRPNRQKLQSLRYVIGSQSLSVLFDSPSKSSVQKLFVHIHWKESAHLKALVEKVRQKCPWVEIHEGGDKKLQSLCQGPSPQGPSSQGAVALVKGAPSWSWEKLEKIKTPVQILCLDGVQDPQNLGAVLRSAWLMGAYGLILPQHRAVHLTPSVHKVACGGVEYVPVLLCKNFQSSFQHLKELGFQILALEPSAKTKLSSHSLPPKVLWLLGGEHSGLRSSTLKHSDMSLSIDQTEANASYNLSVSAALAMHTFVCR